MKTIVGLFDNFNDAQSVVNDLVNSGFDRNHISMVANDAAGQYSTALRSGGGGEGVVRDTDSSSGPVAESAGTGAKAGAYVGGALGLLAGLGALAIPGVGPVIAAGPIMTALGSTALGAGLGAAAGGLIGGLVGLGVPDEEAGYYSEGVRRGGTLVTVSADDAMTQQAVDILNRHNAVDIDQRGSYYQESGYTGFDTTRPAYTADELTTYRQSNPNVYGTAGSTTTMDTATMPAATMTSGATLTSGTQTVEAGDRVAIPIVEEQIAVGKREVERGGARIHTHVEERPVSEQVNLNEERVTVERHAVNQPVTDAATAFREGTIEVTERAEVPVVSKEARVVEEVMIGKEATQRTETVSDTVRRTDVQVEDTTRTAGMDVTPGNNVPGVQTGGRAMDGTPDTRGIMEKSADAVTGDRTDDKTGKSV